MAQISYLKRRGATYYARMPVPLDLQDVAGTRELARSLGTKDPNLAKRLLTPVIRQWQDEFEEMRRRREMTDADLAAATWQHYQQEIAHDDAARVRRPTQTEIDLAKRDLITKAERGEVAADPLAQVDAALDVLVLKDGPALENASRKRQLRTTRDHVAAGETALIEWAADDYIARRGLLITKGSAEYRKLCQHLQRAQMEALTRTLEREMGNFAGTPADPIVAPPLAGQAVTAAPGESVMDLFEQYARENPKKIKPDTLAQSRYSVSLFVQMVGSSFPATRIDKKAVREWKALLLQLPVKFGDIAAFRGKTIRDVVKANVQMKKPTISAKTLNRHLAGLGAFCDWLQRHDYLDANPVIGTYQAIDRQKRTTLPFTTAQMTTLFSSPLFTGCRNDDDWHVPGNHQIRDHRYWLPLVMLYSGARPAEITQLLVSDVRELHGTWIMHITESDEDDKSVKNVGSIRIVPVHPELIKLGFLAYHAGMAAKGEARLFPRAVRNERGQMAANYSRAFARHLIKIGVKSGRGVSLYSFRHGFVDALRRAEYLDEQFGYLVGHSSHTMTGRYGTLPQGMLRQRVEMIEKVSYPGLDLKHLYPASA